MAAKVILTVTHGSLKGQRFEFEECTTCIIGRSPDCHPRIPDDEAHRTISRYHCLLDINPPDMRVRDFGSRNGTYVNGQKIGQRPPGQTPEQGAQMNFPEYDLKSGDELELGNTVFRVTLEMPELAEVTESFPGRVAPTVSISYKKDLVMSTKSDEFNLPEITGYTVVKLLGKGGFGEVYLAIDEATGESVALKMMHPKANVNKDSVEMFWREIENTKALSHPHIVQLRDSGYDRETFFFTLEYCEQGSAASLMQKKGGCLPIEEALSLIYQTLDGLEYAHQAEIPHVKLADGTIGKGKGLVHRDIKPANIFLTQVNNQLVAKVGDYGLAKAFEKAGLSGQTRTGSAAGTPSFMPRQQLIDFKYAKPQVDVWAAAASLYNMLTDRYPRNFTSEDGKRRKDPFLVVLQEDPVPIRHRNSTIPKALADVIDLALFDKKELYFKSADEFKKALENAI